MATATLTPKQKQVKDLLDQGKTPAEVAKTLKVNVNSIYQHIRRMGASGATTKRAGAKRTTARKSTARKSTARKSTTRKPSTRRSATRKSTTRRAPRRPTPAPAPAPVAEARAMTPLQAIRHRKSEIEAQITESARRVAEAEKVYNSEKDSHAKLEANRADELKQLTAAEAALSGAKPKPKRSSAKAGASRNGTGSKAGAKAAAQTAAPAPSAPPTGGQESASTPEPDPTPADAAGTTGSTTEPVEGGELAAVGARVEEERPGVPTEPEFQQEGDDPFAT
jgi:hypothetical protein